jgi:hypothetical protein
MLVGGGGGGSRRGIEVRCGGVKVVVGAYARAVWLFVGGS